MINKQQCGKRLAYYRRQNGFSQGVLAQTLSVTPQAVSKWECGVSHT